MSTRRILYQAFFMAAFIFICCSLHDVSVASSSSPTSFSNGFFKKILNESKPSTSSLAQNDGKHQIDITIRLKLDEKKMFSGDFSLGEIVHTPVFFSKIKHFTSAVYLASIQAQVTCPRGPPSLS